MQLNLKDIIHVPGAVLPFSFQLDLSGLDFYGSRPFAQAVSVTGHVRNMAGALVLEANGEAELQVVCDRCLKPFGRRLDVVLDSLLATELADEASQDEIVLLNGDLLDLDELATTAFILAMDSKNLCSEDCKGLCPGCGVNLNEEPCRCKPQVDPRLAALGQLLED